MPQKTISRPYGKCMNLFETPNEHKHNSQGLFLGDAHTWNKCIKEKLIKDFFNNEVPKDN
jgi:hypothetical protein